MRIAALTHHTIMRGGQFWLCCSGILRSYSLRPLEEVFRHSLDHHRFQQLHLGITLRYPGQLVGVSPVAGGPAQCAASISALVR